MRTIAGVLLVAGVFAMNRGTEWAQIGQEVAVQAPDTRTEKQKALAMQTERLYTMATELKAQVDLTNKNILSMKVVRKAEEIEALAKGMRGQGKK